MNNALPKLFLKDPKGKHREWSVLTEGNKITVAYGQIGGKITEKVTYAKGKNKGRSNETTDSEQAVKEAESKWLKQIQREDYHYNIEESNNQIRPMLALDASKVGHRIDWGQAVCQPKFDGLRLTVGNRYKVKFDPEAIEFMSRKGDTYETLDHLRKPCENLLLQLNDIYQGEVNVLALDGEIYLHGLSRQQIQSRASSYKEGLTEQLEFHIFDIVVDGDNSFFDRLDRLNECFSADKGMKMVQEFACPSEEAMHKQHDQFKQEGYEGIIIRHAKSPYEMGKRGSGLFKFKKMLDKECLIIDVWEDKNGNAMFKCLWNKDDPNSVFDVTPKRSHDERKQILVDKDQYINKWVVIQYQSETDDGLPEFPIALELRECTDDGQPVF